MSPKFNEPKISPSVRVATHPDATINYEGGLAFNASPLTKLYMQAATCLIKEPKFYQSKEDSHAEFEKTVSEAIKIDPLFVLQLAVYCREELFLRSVPLFLVNKVAYEKAEPIPASSKYVTRVIQRADELSELMALAMQGQDKLKGKYPLMIKRGVGNAFGKFDEYQFGKYKRSDKAVTLRDTLFITHPKADTPEREAWYKNIAENTIPIPDTWETYISTNGSTAENWEHIIPKMGYMAILRNLRNFLKVDISTEKINYVANRISEPEQVARSKQLPFRFLSAYKMLKGSMGMSDSRWGSRGVTPMDGIDHLKAGILVDAVERALDASVVNLPQLPGKTLIAIDTSGSMTSTISDKSVLRCIDISTLMGTIAKFVYPESDTYVFGQNIKHIPLQIDRARPRILSHCLKFLDAGGDSWVGHSTNGHLVTDHLCATQEKFDRLMFFTDEQLWDSTRHFYGYGSHAQSSNLAQSFLRYRQQVNQNASCYVIDLTGYGKLLFPEGTPGVFNLAGWTNSIFRLMEAIEVDPNTVVKRIKGIAP